MKAKKPEVLKAEFRVWCEECHIRIAPHEERTLEGGMTYHRRCYSKLPVANGKSKSAASQSL